MDKKLKMSDSDKKAIYLLASILVVAVAYFFGFSPLKNSAAEIKTKNEELTKQVRELQDMALKTDTQKKLIKEYDTGAKLMKAYLPSSISEEKIITVITDLENKTGIGWSDLTMQLRQPLATDDANKTVSDENSTEIKEGVGYVNNVTLSFKNLTYENLKKVIQYFNEQTDRITISDLQTSYDTETNKLQGTMEIGFYCLANNSANQYTAPEISNVDVPVSGKKTDLFGVYGSH